MSERVDTPAAPDGYATINPFIITDDANGQLRYIQDTLLTGLASIEDLRLAGNGR